MDVVDLRVAGVTEPSCLHDPTPTLSWRLDSKRRGSRQTAFIVAVATSPERIRAGDSDLWDSGRIENDAMQVCYAGPELISRQRCFWGVTVWDEQGEAARSPCSSWEMGLLSPSDWVGEWLAAEDEEYLATRATQPTWLGVANPMQDGCERSFTGSFVTTEPGVVHLTVAATSQAALSCLRIDDTDLPVQSLEGFVVGVLAALQHTVEVLAGEHRIALTLKYLPPLPVLEPPDQIGFAVHIVQKATSGRVVELHPRWQAQNGAKRAPPVELSDQPAMPWPATPAQLLRRRFDISGEVSSARLYVTALGSYEARLNGKKVSIDVLAPEANDFRRRILYRAHDVTALLSPGENVLASIVGDGWFGSAQIPSGRYGYLPAPRRLIAQLEINFADGTNTIIATDGEWQTFKSPIIASEIYHGETYDARLEQDGWDAPGFDEKGWSPAATGPSCAALLKGQVAPPIRATRFLSPTSVLCPAEGVYVFDFGQNFAGWCKLRVLAAPGQQFTLRFAEVVDASGRADQTNLRTARSTDIYIARGLEQGETFEPRFTYHGFRYVEIEGFTTAPDDDALAGVVIHSDLRETGSFSIDQPLVEKLWANAFWSQRSNLVGIPTDCPQRDERLGWGGDAQVFWDAAAFNMDVAAFTRRYLDCFRDAQSPETGAFDLWAPKPDEPLFRLESPTPGWAEAGVVLPWTSFMRYGDTAIIRENWSAMTAFVNGVMRENADIWRTGRGLDLGDWLSPDLEHGWEDGTPRDLIATALLIRTCDQVAEMGAAIGRQDEAHRHAHHASVVRRAFAREFLSPDGSVGNGSQTSQILALAFRCVPEARRPEVAAVLCDDIRRRGHLTTGFLGTPYSLDVLADSGFPELAYDLLLRTDYPSWGYMVAKGATSIWERWNADRAAGSSFNHYALGSLCGFLYRRVAGIEPIAPGFARVRIRPLFDRRIAKAGATFESVRGTIASHWSREQGRLTLNLKVPPNTIAEVHLPASVEPGLLESGRSLDTCPTASVRPNTGSKTLVDLQSGEYCWVMPDPIVR